LIEREKNLKKSATEDLWGPGRSPRIKGFKLRRELLRFSEVPLGGQVVAWIDTDKNSHPLFVSLYNTCDEHP
jgi:hypothetical protein